MQSLHDHLDTDLECEGVLTCVHGFGKLEQWIYFYLLEVDRCLTIEEITAAVDRNRSTTYRAVRRLHEAGYLEKEQLNYENGGYCYRYEAVNPETVAAKLKLTVSEWHNRLDSLVDEFRDTYGNRSND